MHGRIVVVHFNGTCTRKNCGLCPEWLEFAAFGTPGLYQIAKFLSGPRLFIGLYLSVVVVSEEVVKHSLYDSEYCCPTHLGCL